MTFDINFQTIPWGAWAAAGLGALWVVKAWADKRYEPLAPKKPQAEIERDEIDLGRRILQSKAFVEAADHQVHTTMLSDRFHQSVEGVVLSSAKIISLIDAKAGERVAAQVGEKITGMGDTQRMMLESLKEIKKSIDDLKLSNMRLETRFEEHVKKEES